MDIVNSVASVVGFASHTYMRFRYSSSSSSSVYPSSIPSSVSSSISSSARLEVDDFIKTTEVKESTGVSQIVLQCLNPEEWERWNSECGIFSIPRIEAGLNAVCAEQLNITLTELELLLTRVGISIRDLRRFEIDFGIPLNIAGGVEAAITEEIIALKSFYRHFLSEDQITCSPDWKKWKPFEQLKFLHADLPLIALKLSTKKKNSISNYLLIDGSQHLPLKFPVLPHVMHLEINQVKQTLLQKSLYCFPKVVSLNIINSEIGTKFEGLFSMSMLKSLEISRNDHEHIRSAIKEDSKKLSLIKEDSKKLLLIKENSKKLLLFDDAIRNPHRGDIIYHDLISSGLASR